MTLLKIDLSKFDRAKYHHILGSIKTKRKQFQKALKSHQQAVSLNDIGDLYKEIGDCQTMKRRRLFERNQFLIIILFSNQFLTNCQGQYRNGIKNYQEALKILKRTLPDINPNRSEEDQEIGTVYKCIKDYTRPLKCFERVNRIKTRSMPFDHPDIDY